MPKRLGTLFQAKRYLLLGLGALIPMTLSAAGLTPTQQRYLDAREALDKGQLDSYQALRKQDRKSVV